MNGAFPTACRINGSGVFVWGIKDSLPIYPWQTPCRWRRGGRHAIRSRGRRAIAAGDRDAVGRLDTDSHRLGTDADHGDDDAITDENLLPNLSRQYKHDATRLRRTREDPSERRFAPALTSSRS
jgi:hypothetical protein